MRALQAEPAFSAQVSARVAVLARGLPRSLREPVCTLAARPGKGLRPMLLAACAQFGHPNPERLVRAGTVAELIHLASLLHDDMIDRSATRRGGPAAHTVVGRDLATLAGVGCFALASQEAAGLGTEIAQLVGQAAARLAYGEVLDLERAFDTAMTITAYLELAERKTGELFRLCCLLGAVEADVPAGTAHALAGFGLHLGVAFQIQDDCLDLAPGGTGKPSGTDHLLGLFGAPTLYALAADDAGELASLLLSPGFGPEDVPAVRALVERNGGLAAAAKLAGEQWSRAAATLGSVNEHPALGALMQVSGMVWRQRP